MDNPIGEEPPPRSTDLDGWRRAVADGRFGNFKMEVVIAAVQDLGPETDPSVLNPLLIHVSDTILRILRGKVGINHRNKGEDIIADAHGQLLAALFDPNSADGKALRTAFVPRIAFRAADAIRVEQKRETREHAVESIEALEDKRQPQVDPREELNQKLYVEEVLSHITDERKRLAFRLYMEEYPLESTRSTSISEALGVSAKTAGQWIEEIQALLRNIIGEKP